ncbi:hypothetical protein [Saccharopolyspora phatthalungensis]|uniref:Uncharacterized protein n=1 Tax=Saccharopolyspora phatthalungensis TaxID=664693 RepID=A0A840Q7N0_9PSEU|nr:hypothetical protein [Saccharopolyspora phatthalungensis]MBB5156456.1 hypothetical protein [Saccharopolyspora phatthalungensis]
MKLKVHREKSSVRHAREATLLGFGFYFSRSGGEGIRRIACSPILQRALPNAYWDDLGLLGLRNTWHRLRTTA